MATNVFGVLVILFGFVIQFMHHKYAIYGMLALTLFGAAAAVTLPAMGGASILVANVFMVFFALRILAHNGISAGVQQPALSQYRLLVVTPASFMACSRPFSSHG